MAAAPRSHNSTPFFLAPLVGRSPGLAGPDLQNAGQPAQRIDYFHNIVQPDAMHPEYPTQATYNAVTAVAVLESVFGPVKAIPLTATDARDPKKTRAFATLADIRPRSRRMSASGAACTIASPSAPARMRRRRPQPS
jgi:hypothetical protein